MIELYPYQKKAIKMLYDAIRAGHRKLVWSLPTGAGKSTLASYFVSACINKGKKVVFVVHSEELVGQFYERLLKQFGISSSIIMSGQKANYAMSVQVCSLMTLIRRRVPDADVLIIDECHRSRGNSYQKIIEMYSDSLLLGLTATPYRTDGKGLGKNFDVIVNPVKLAELVKLGRLVRTKVFVPEKKIDLSQIDLKTSKNGRDYDQTQLFEAMDNEDVYQQIVDEYKNKADGLKTIVFNINRVAHSKKMNEYFLKNGIPSAHVDGETPKAERKRIVQKFRSGEIMILNNCDLVTEGFDVPDAECVILNRATKSKGLYVQMVGRGIRYNEGKGECIVLDFGQNTFEHGFVEDYDQEEFTLKDRKKKKKGDAPVKECPKCHTVMYASVRNCTTCGYVFPSKKEVIEAEGVSLKLLDRDQQAINRISRKRWEKLKLHELRPYALYKGFRKGWHVHHAIKEKLVDVNPTDPNRYKEVNFLCELAESNSSSPYLLEKLKKQGYEWGHRYKKNQAVQERA